MIELPDPAAADASIRREWFERAHEDLADALAIAPGLGLARLRLARVLWRLGEPEPARHHLETALASPGPVGEAVPRRGGLGNARGGQADG